MSEIVYLDICCFKRPFDDAALERVRREAEAIAALCEHFNISHWIVWFPSDARSLLV